MAVRIEKTISKGVYVGFGGRLQEYLGLHFSASVPRCRFLGEKRCGYSVVEAVRAGLVTSKLGFTPGTPGGTKQHLILPGVPGVETAYAGLHGLPPKGSCLALEGRLPLFANCR